MAQDEDRPQKPKRLAKKTKKMDYSSSAKPQVSDVIGRRLKSYYDELAAQPIPDRFLDLLNQLESASQPKKTDE